LPLSGSPLSGTGEKRAFRGGEEPLKGRVLEGAHGREEGPLLDLTTGLRGGSRRKIERWESSPSGKIKGGKGSGGAGN